MITFNAILRNEGVDPAKVLLVRHQWTKRGSFQTPYAVWRRNPDDLDLYQRIQSKDRFPIGAVIASFVVSATDTLFVGLYRVVGRGTAPADQVDPVTGGNVAGMHLYDIEPDDRLSAYRGLLTIQWGEGFRSWIQKASRQDKPLIEMRKTVSEPRFPGFTRFTHDIDTIETIPNGWKEVLRAVKGVYVLVCKETGKLYVGSAKGSDSLYGRFVDYAITGHGGNVEMKKRGRKPYQATVLEIVNSGQDIELLEEIWKRKLMSREFGLNGPDEKIVLPSSF